MLISMSKTKVIVCAIGQPDMEFDGDSVSLENSVVSVYNKGKVVACVSARRQGRPPSHAYVVKPKKWKLKFIKE